MTFLIICLDASYLLIKTRALLNKAREFAVRVPENEFYTGLFT